VNFRASKSKVITATSRRSYLPQENSTAVSKANAKVSIPVWPAGSLLVRHGPVLGESPGTLREELARVPLQQQLGKERMIGRRGLR
jgi:hypothetical protein